MSSEEEKKEGARSGSRRSFLKKGLAGGVVLLLGGSGLALWPTREIAAPIEPLLSLQPDRFQVLVAFAARVVTAPGADPVKIAHGVDRGLSYALPEVRRDINAVLGLFDNALAGLVLDLRVAPFTRLPPESQDRVLDAWRSSRVAVRRSGLQALRRLCLTAHYVDEVAWPSIQYVPPTGLNAMAYDDSKAGTPEWLEAQPKGGGG